MEIRPDLPEQDPETPLRRARQPMSWWGLVSAIAFALIFGIGGLYALQMLARPLAMFILAFSLAAALSPVVDWLCCGGRDPRGRLRLKSPRLPRWAAVILVYLLLILLLLAVVAMAVPVLTDQATALFNSVDSWLPRINDWAIEFGLDPGGLLPSLTSELGRLSAFLITVPLNLASGLADFFLILFISLYWVLLIPKARRFAMSFFPGTQQSEASEVMARMGGAMGGYVRGSAIDGLIVGTAVYIGLSIIGVPYALFLAVFAGLMEFFPIIGPVLSVGISVLVALTISPVTALITLIFGVILQQVESNILVPIIMRSQAEISPLLSIFAVITGGAIGGLLGALVAIPLASALQVLVVMVIAPALRQANGVEVTDSRIRGLED
jgi:predicted PurR-regulated permease PerM